MAGSLIRHIRRYTSIVVCMPLRAQRIACGFVVVSVWTALSIVSLSSRFRVVVVVGSKHYANYTLLYNKQQGLTSQGLFNEYLLNNETTIHNRARMNKQTI